MLDGPAPAVWLLGCLVTASLAGCLGGTSEAIDLPDLVEGDRFVYEGADGTRLTVQAAGSADRVDHHLRIHDALILNITLRGDDGDSPFTIWEAVDPSNGLLVQQTARCGWVPDSGGCLDERALVVLGAGGLPGGFGAAPLWGSEVERTNASMAIRTEDLDLEAITLTYETAHVESPEAQAGPCLSISRETVNRSVYRTLVSSFSSPITVCDGIPLPVAFETEHGDTFQLVDHTLAPDRDQPRKASGGWEPTQPPVPLTNWTAPLPTHHPDDPTPFPVREAHREALKKSDAYRSLFERKPESLVMRMGGVYRGSGQDVGLLRTEHDQRSLTAYAPDGEWLHVVVKRTRNSTGPEDDPVSENVSYTITKEETGRQEIVPSTGSLAPRQAAIPDVYELGSQLVGQEPSTEGFYSSAYPAFVNQPLRGGTANRTDGWTLRAYLTDSTPVAGGGIAYRVPYQFSVDGPTGAVVYLTLDRARLPLSQHVGG